MAHLYAKTVTFGETPWEETNEVMSRNRRIGTSVSGVAQFLQKHNIDTLREWLETGYQELRACDARVSDQFDVPTSIKLTSVKPSGTVSLLAGATPGMHYPISSYYLRRIRLPTDSPMTQALRQAGYHIEDAVEGNKTSVVSFPVYVGDHLPRSSEVSIWQQLSLAAFLQKYWSDNAVSCTATFDPEKESKESLVAALEYFQYQLKGISFLPNLPNVYAQMPYEEISKQQYLEMIKDIKSIDWSILSSGPSIPREHEFCDTDKCEIQKK